MCLKKGRITDRQTFNFHSLQGKLFLVSFAITSVIMIFATWIITSIAVKTRRLKEFCFFHLCVRLFIICNFINRFKLPGNLNIPYRSKNNKKRRHNDKYVSYYIGKKSIQKFNHGNACRKRTDKSSQIRQKCTLIGENSTIQRQIIAQYHPVPESAIVFQQRYSLPIILEPFRKNFNHIVFFCEYGISSIPYLM